mmetsp:Transcript_25621/g.74059  ORF Transcript_25621/g.74059 Transcript_25621/m.74059 type:complete len:275 (-) Transcript_25621:1114-1938(-)
MTALRSRSPKFSSGPAPAEAAASPASSCGTTESAKLWPWKAAIRSSSAPCPDFAAGGVFSMANAPAPFRSTAAPQPTSGRASPDISRDSSSAPVRTAVSCIFAPSSSAVLVMLMTASPNQSPGGAAAEDVTAQEVASALTSPRSKSRSIRLPRAPPHGAGATSMGAAVAAAPSAGGGAEAVPPLASVLSTSELLKSASHCPSALPLEVTGVCVPSELAPPDAAACSGLAVVSFGMPSGPYWFPRREATGRGAAAPHIMQRPRCPEQPGQNVRQL